MDFNRSSKWQVGEFRRLGELLTVVQFMAECRHNHVTVQTSASGLTLKVFTDTEEESAQVCEFVSQFLSPQWGYYHSAHTYEGGDFYCDTYNYEFQEWGE